MNITGKNLLDDKEIINNYIEYLNDNNENIVSVEINQYTKDYLEEKGIYKIANALYIINNNLSNYEIKFNRQKKIKAIEYVPYEVKDESKEILDKLKSIANSKMDFTYTIIQKLEAKSLYNYITNLEKCYCNRTDCSTRIKDSKKYDSLLQGNEKLQEENKRLQDRNIELVLERDRLKEILDKLEEVKDSVGTFIGIDNKGANLLLDYITNLQEKYNEYKNLYFSEYKVKEDYKSRNEKAIENIDLVIELIKQQPTEDDTWILNKLNGFKYLLQGEDKDE